MSKGCTTTSRRIASSRNQYRCSSNPKLTQCDLFKFLKTRRTTRGSNCWRSTHGWKSRVRFYWRSKLRRTWTRKRPSSLRASWNPFRTWTGSMPRSSTKCQNTSRILFHLLASALVMDRSSTSNQMKVPAIRTRSLTRKREGTMTNKRYYCFMMNRMLICIFENPFVYLQLSHTIKQP